jgi:leader peptidase (prepilin peptidase) / N-methyltransferase
MDPFVLSVAAITGTIVGSFLNVVIWRLPRGESLVRPGSHCPVCGRPIAWFDNVPVLAWLWLRARCRACKAPIPIRYPFVEASTGALFVLAVLRWGDHLPTAAFVAVALAALLAVSFIDWEHKIIPDRITKPGIAVAILLAPALRLHPGDWIPGLAGRPALVAWLHAGAGAATGALVVLGIRGLGSLLLRKEAMGLGDVKLLALVGALVGPLLSLYALVLASLSGAIVGLLRLVVSRSRPLRFHLEVRGGGESDAFPAARIVGEDLLVTADREGEDGRAVKVRMRLPAAGILEDHDAEVEVGGRLVGSEPRGERFRWRIRVEQAAAPDRERLALFAASWRYVPFGPFLALGGAIVLLQGEAVHWLITRGYPRWVQGLWR